MVTGSDPMATYHFADCVNWHKMKINVSLKKFIIIESTDSISRDERDVP